MPVICAKCYWYKEAAFGCLPLPSINDYYTCLNPESEMVNIITGSVSYNNCAYMRSPGRKCGPDGEMFYSKYEESLRRSGK